MYEPFPVGEFCRCSKNPSGADLTTSHRSARKALRFQGNIGSFPRQISRHSSRDACWHVDCNTVLPRGKRGTGRHCRCFQVATPFTTGELHHDLSSSERALADRNLPNRNADLARNCVCTAGRRSGFARGFPCLSWGFARFTRTEHETIPQPRSQPAADARQSWSQRAE